jgi:hypothetical protein
VTARVPDPEARCPVCSAPATRLRYSITRFRIYDCADCATVYLWPQIDDAEVRQLFDRLYTAGEGSVPELATYYDFTYHDEPENPLVQTYERWLDALERERPPGRILDIGCGTGLFLAVARRRGWQPTASTTACPPSSMPVATSASRCGMASSRTSPRARACASTRSRCGTSSSTRAPRALLAAARGRARAGRA